MQTRPPKRRKFESNDESPEQHSLPTSVPLINPADFSANSFHRYYISKRLPCCIQPPSPSDPTWKTHKWSNDYLRRHAGDAMVQVEQRAHKDSGFGQGNKVRMAFNELITEVERGNTDLYMTTQYKEGEDEEDEEESLSEARYLVAPPLTHLLCDFPLIPPLFGVLIPHQYNLWFGSAHIETSSGLHHDYHDNLYYLLRGQKRITLIPPVYARQLLTTGQVKEVKKNGLICYDDHVYSDGSTEAERRREKQKIVEQHIQTLEHQLNMVDQSTRPTRAALIKEALTRYEASLDKLLNQALEDNDRLEDQDDLRDDFDDFVHDEHDEDQDEDQSEDDEGPDDKQMNNTPSMLAAAREGSPPNFSRLSTSTLPDDIPHLTVTLTGPAMLYIPASWFHEVFSLGGTDGQGHMALNYWFRPPDHLNHIGSTRFCAYEEELLWKHRWKREERLLINLCNKLAASRKDARQKTGAVFGSRRRQRKEGDD